MGAYGGQEKIRKNDTYTFQGLLDEGYEIQGTGNDIMVFLLD